MVRFRLLTLQSDEVFGARLRTLQRRPDSFAEQQIKLAKEQAETALDLGQHKFQCVQGMSCTNGSQTSWLTSRLVTVMLTWFYWCNGRYGVTAFISYRLSDVLILGGQK